ncbi:ABC transporter substrate-binding protein/permease [Chitinispirillales bacterium ANBcel5]|uniref:ABC transporter substrate-binding protein/permease n=1 Tax=Cellulosispirillum alkaliphilum TaxID=3039283 RepID=UPI002A507341|nr:ABC transporter substrate-binding protein/permease [Chitinispirillales bacterium ANBcel5]
MLKKLHLFLLFLLFCLFFSTPFAEQQTLSVALTGQYPPFSFYNVQGELDGFDVDVSKAIADHLGYELEIITTEWDGILAGLLANRYDAIIGSMAITAQRAERVSFSTPYYTSGAQVFINLKDKGEIEGIEDLSGKRVGVVRGETYEHFLRENHPEVQVVTYRSTVDIFQDMNNNRLEAFLSDRLVGLHQIKSANMPFILAGDLLYEEQMGIPVRKQNTELLGKINQALETMESDGTLEEIHARYFGPATVSIAEEGASESMSMGLIASMLIQGFVITIGVAIASILAGLILAIPVGVILHSEPRVWYTIFRSITDFIRGTPVLIQLFFVYFGAPQLGISLSPIASAIITLSLNSAAYMSEVIRSGLMAVDKGQGIAARALGLNRREQFLYVVWPQAFRVALPPLVNSAVALLKDTALVSVISVNEIITETQSIISVTYDPMRFYFIVAIMFFAFTYPLMQLAGKIERNLKSKGYTV